MKKIKSYVVYYKNNGQNTSTRIFRGYVVALCNAKRIADTVGCTEVKLVGFDEAAHRVLENDIEPFKARNGV